MDALTFLTVKAAALKAASALGVRAGETDIGLPARGAAGAAPSPGDLARATEYEASLVSKGTRAGAVPTGGPLMGGRSSPLLQLLKTRGGKAGVGLAALGGLGGAGYGLFGGGGAGAPAPQAPAPEAAPAPPPHPRQTVRRTAWGNAGKAVGNWWGRMKDRYAIGAKRM